MSTTTNRKTASRDGDSVDHRLARLLDTPLLTRVVPHLPPETLHQLIQHRGLDACVELVTSATPAQLTSLLDLDLWRHAQPGRDEQFDVDRFGEWLEVLVDSGDSVAARTVAALDKQLVILGLSRYLRVFDPGTFEPHESSDDESLDRNEKMKNLPDEEQERVRGLVDREQQINKLAAQNPSFTGDLLRTELVKTHKLVESFLDVALTVNRYENYLQSVDVRALGVA